MSATHLFKLYFPLILFMTSFLMNAFAFLWLLLQGFILLPVSLHLKQLHPSRLQFTKTVPRVIIKK